MSETFDEAWRRRELRVLAGYDLAGRNEAEVRADFIDPLLRLLGYGPGTRHEVLRERELRLAPPVRKIGSHVLKIDYEPTVFGRRLWIIEAKRPQEDLFADEHVGQAWSYATDPRIAVPLMVLCDGVRLAVFDLTTESWQDPVFDAAKVDLPDRFDELFGWLGAPRVAEKVRRRQLEHLRLALESQVDLDALDRTIADVQAIVDEVRPNVVERRRQIRDEARERVRTAGAAAIEAAGMWGHAQDVNGPAAFRMADIDRAVEIVRASAPIVRVREFDNFERATTPKGQTESRMWFGLRAIRMGAAVLLCDDDGCGEHCEQAARQAARQHATGFADAPLLAAGYRLQRALGRTGWRMAPLMKPMLDEQAKRLVTELESEEWLRRDGEIGVTSYDSYRRVAELLPRMLLARLDPWDVETLNRTAAEYERSLDSLPKPPGFEQLQPATDPWYDSWADGDPLYEWSRIVLNNISARTGAGRPADLAAELAALYTR